MDKRRRFEAILLKCPTIIQVPKIYDIGLYLYGFECGLGWYSIIESALEQIESIVSRMPKEEINNYHVLRVQDELGELIITMSETNSDINNIIIEAQNKCRVTCSICGEPGEYQDGIVICAPCKEDRKIKRGLS